MHLLDQRVALRAGRHHVQLVDAGSPVRVRQDEVRRVAGGADGRDRQTLTKQTLAVNREGVVLEDLVLRDAGVPS